MKKGVKAVCYPTDIDKEDFKPVRDSRVIYRLYDIIDAYRARKIIERLQEINKSEWARICYSFEKWEFPIEFYDLMPSWWNDFVTNNYGKTAREYNIIYPVIHKIRKEIGRYGVLRYLHVTVRLINPDEFEYWYSRFGEQYNEEEFNAYHEKKRKFKKIRWWDDEVFSKLPV